jgi:D-serine deaminase-like pyridoxal phosphate-dependent protein
MTDLDVLAAATAQLDPPLAALDLAAVRANAADLVRRAGSTPVRVASKSVRCRHVLELVLATPGFAGVLSYALPEALWLARAGLPDVLLGYPSADRGALAEFGADPALHESITLMVDGSEQLDLIRSVTDAPLRVCLDVAASLRIGRLHLGVRRSPLRTPADAAGLARDATGRGLRVVGLMFYEAQIAGLPDSSPAVRLVKRRSAAELAVRRGAVVGGVEDELGGKLEIVNAGGTGSLEVSSADPCVTEVSAGSGLYVPTLFDRYRAFVPRPALFFALPVVRRPAPGIATLFGGGYIASGPAGKTRVPSPATRSLKLIATEGAGEVQTPVRGPGAAALRVGDRVWFRHAKAGELCERFDTIHVVDGDRLVESVPTYRGEGRNFG